jgi:hypothetical protein
MFAMVLGGFLALQGCGLTAYNQDDGNAGGQLLPLVEIGSYEVRLFSIRSETDNDGDGLVDNHLPTALAAVNALLPEEGFDLESFNERITEGIELSRIYLDARRQGTLIDIDIAVAFSEEPGEEDASYAKALPSARLSGNFVEGNSFVAGPDDLELHVIGALDQPPVPIQLQGAMLEGSIDELGVRGIITARIPVESLMEDVVEPLLPAEGWDLDGDGTLESYDEVRDFVWELAPQIADVTLPDGSTAISVMLDLDALPRSEP